MPRRIALAIVLPFTIASLGACSSKPGSPAASPSPSTATDTAKARYIAQGDAVCRDIAAVPDGIPLPTEDTDPALAAYFQQSLDATRPKVEQFKALDPPDADQAVADQLNALYGELLARVGDLIAAYRAGNAEAIRSEDDAINALEAKLKTAAAAYGFTVCGAT